MTDRGQPPNLERLYVLLVLNTHTDEVKNTKSWLNDMVTQCHCEKLFSAYITGSEPLEQPVGLAALLTFDTPQEMRSAILRIREDLAHRNAWKYELLKADWIEVKMFTRDRTKVQRKVGTDGRISFMGHRYHISERLRDQLVEPVLAGGKLEIYHDGVLVKVIEIRK